MQRSRHLIPLSHDHHHALVHALRLRRADASDQSHARDVARAAVEFHGRVLEPHAREEEQLVAAAIRRDPDEMLVETLVRLVSDHAVIADRMAALRDELATATELDVSHLHALGAELNAHVRWEERTVFGDLQARFGEALGSLGDHVSDHDA